MAWDPGSVQRWKHKVGIHNRGVQWAPMARWAGEGKDRIKLMTQKKNPREEDVIRSLLESMKQAVEKKKEPNGTLPTEQPRDLPPLNSEYR